MFVHPFGLLALIAVPVVVALHLFRRRFEPRKVSALFLWKLDDRVPIAGRKRERLVASASFWLEIAAAALLAVAFGSPRASCAGGRAQHLVVVLDSSASMGSVVDGASLRDKAVKLVEERIRALSQRSRVTLVRSGPRPSVLAGPAALPAEALERLSSWQPLAAHHDLTPALGIASQLAGAAAVVVVTDHYEPDLWPADIELASVGEPVDNLALVHAARTRERNADGAAIDKAFVTVASFAEKPRKTNLRVLAAGRTIAAREIELAPRARQHFSFELSPDTPVVEVRIDPDALAVDDVALLAPPPRRTIALATTLPPEEARALGLTRGADGAIDRWLGVVDDSIASPTVDGAHLVIGRGIQGGAQTWCLAFEPQQAERKDLIGPFFAEKSHALLQGLTLEGIVWSVDPALVLAGAPLVSAGNNALLTEDRAAQRTVWRINCDPMRSSLQRSPDWPIFLANMAELRRAALPGPLRTSLLVGETFEYRPGNEWNGADASGELRYELRGPGGGTREIPSLGRVIVDDLVEPGIYRLSARGQPVAEFALSFVDPSESDTTAMLPGLRPSSLATAEIDADVSWIELALIGAAFAAIAFDWLVLARAQRFTRPAVA